MGTDCCYITRENDYSKIKYNFMIIRFLKCQEKTEQDQLSNRFEYMLLDNWFQWTLNGLFGMFQIWVWGQ